MLFPAKSSGVVWIIRRRALHAKRYQELRGTVLYLSFTMRPLKVAIAVSDVSGHYLQRRAEMKQVTTQWVISF
jgi:hypothetical protein